MTLSELKAQCLKVKGYGSSQVLLVIPRKWPPKEDYIRVKGLGKGLMVNVIRNEDKTWRICAYFNVDTILKTIAKQEAMDLAHAEKESDLPPCACKDLDCPRRHVETNS